MATLLELRNLFNDGGDLKNKIDMALVIAANNLLNGTPTANDRAWAYQILSKPRPETEKALKVLLAENKDATVATINGATDATIQSAIDGTVVFLVLAFNGG